ncbi:MAG TPA: ParB/RepB/Spo0J family partition protein [Rhizomicrobium sp.]
MELSHIPIEKLHIAAVNMRHGKHAPDISDILPSVRARGILQPLLVRPNADGYEIVAGRRRYFSAKAVAAEQGAIAPLPCAIMEAGDDAAAIEASLIENVARRDADPMTEFETFCRLIKEGKTVDSIAATFGITEIVVKQRLALANLLPKIRDAYRNEDIDDETIRHLTLASKSQQKEWLAMFECEDGNAPFGYQLKQWLFGGQQISTKIALFDLADYKGHTVTDLFDEESYFADADLFWQMQNAAIEAKAEALREAGWSDVVILEAGAHFSQWEYEKTPKKKGGKVFIEVSHRGEIVLHEGCLGRKDARRAAKGEAVEVAAAAKDARPQMTQAMENYLELHRHAVVRLALLRDPATAFRLMVAHVLAPTGNWTVKPDPQRARGNDIGASITASTAQGKFDEERGAVSALLGVAQEGGTAAIFAHLLTLSDAEVMCIAAFAMADTLAVGDTCVEAAGLYLKANAGEVWNTDEVFFDLLRDRATINAMLAEVAGKSVAEGNLGEKVKTQKKIMRDCLAGENWRSKVEGWLPGWMQFPFKPYGKGKSAIAHASQEASRALKLA